MWIIIYRDINADLENLCRQGFTMHTQSDINRDNSQKLQKYLKSHRGSTYISELSDKCLSNIFEYLSVVERFSLRRGTYYNIVIYYSTYLIFLHAYLLLQYVYVGVQL